MDSVWSLSEGDLRRLKDSRVIVSMSGGKDSTACALLLERHGVEFDAVFMDTGWEHPAIYDYIHDVLEPRFGTIQILKSAKYPGGMDELVRKNGIFPDAKARFCTRELKLVPFNNYLERLDEDAIYVVGIRRQESKSRANASRWDYDEKTDCDVFRPLVEHSFDDVIRMHQEGGIPPNPLYLQGATRVGCFPCVFAKKSEVDQVAKLWPKKIDQIEKLETDLENAVREKYQNDEEYRKKADAKIRRLLAYMTVIKPAGVSAENWKLLKKGEYQLDAETESKYTAVLNIEKSHPDFLRARNSFFKRTYFRDRAGLQSPTIREIVEWSKTSLGGRQYQLFDLGAQDGCLRWGMCESPLADEELVKIKEPAEG